MTTISITLTKQKLIEVNLIYVVWYPRPALCILSRIYPYTTYACGDSKHCKYLELRCVVMIYQREGTLTYCTCK